MYIHNFRSPQKMGTFVNWLQNYNIFFTLPKEMPKNVAQRRVEHQDFDGDGAENFLKV